jgi:hypothetical protein
MSDLLHTLRSGDERLTGQFDHAFAPANNPWRHLGAMAFLCLVISVISGIIAFALYDTSVAGAYESGRRLQLDPLMFGRLLRGMHRYAADGFMLLSVLHLVREAARGHYRGVRWFSWITGVPLLWLLWIAGITGFWLLWDERALFSVTASAEWLQALPVSSDLLVRNFLVDCFHAHRDSIVLAGRRLDPCAAHIKGSHLATTFTDVELRRNVCAALPADTGREPGAGQHGSCDGDAFPGLVLPVCSPLG